MCSTTFISVTNIPVRYLEGARWDIQKGLLRDSFLKELHPLMPVMHLSAVEVEALDLSGKYECPIFYTATRGGTFTFSAQLKTGAHTLRAAAVSSTYSIMTHFCRRVFHKVGPGWGRHFIECWELMSLTDRGYGIPLSAFLANPMYVNHLIHTYIYICLTFVFNK
jgi:hypothetical protein